jgi:hypothetical protein
MDNARASQPDFVTAYIPTAVYYEAADSVEYVRRDEPCVYRRVDELLTLVLSMRTRKPLGFRLKGFRHFYLEFVKGRPIDAKGEFPMLMPILEEATKALGNQILEQHERRIAYLQARDIAGQDQVRLSELPAVA